MNTKNKYSVFSLNEKQQWSDFLSRMPGYQQDIYFTHEYYKLYEDYGDGKALCFAYERDKELALYPFLMNSINELGYELETEYYDIQGAYGYNGVVSNSYKSDFIDEFYNAFEEYTLKNNIVTEFTRFHPLLENYKFSITHLEVVYDRKTIYLDLSNTYNEIFKTFQTTTKKQIKRCYNKYNIKIEIIENNASFIKDFVDIYKDAMNRVDSNEYLHFNLKYFTDLILSTNSAMFIARSGEKPIAAILVFYNKNYIHGHLGGALTDYLYTSVYSMLYFEIIKFGIEKGCKYFHVGGGTTGKSDDSLLQFKSNFSRTMADFFVGKKIYNKQIYDEIVKDWALKYPEKVERYKNFLLKYRY